MSKQVVENSCIPDRYDQLEIWNKLPLTDAQRVRVLKAMREEAAATVANSDSDSTVDQKEESNEVNAETEAKTGKISVHN